MALAFAGVFGRRCDNIPLHFRIQPPQGKSRGNGIEPCSGADAVALGLLVAEKENIRWLMVCFGFLSAAYLDYATRLLPQLRPQPTQPGKAPAHAVLPRARFPVPAEGPVDLGLLSV